MGDHTFNLYLKKKILIPIYILQLGEERSLLRLLFFYKLDKKINLKIQGNMIISFDI